MEKEEYKQIELRSEEVQEVMGQVPPWILRWGITVLAIIVIGLFIGCYFFKYPDTLTAEVTITTTTPPINVIARSTGKLDQIYVHNGQSVQSGEVLAVIQNTADYEDVKILSAKMQDWVNGRLELKDLNQWMDNTTLKLGEMQGTYASFMKCLRESLDYRKFNYYPKKIQMKLHQKAKQEEIFARMKEERELGKRQMEIASSIFYRDSILRDKQISTGEDYDRALQTYLQSKQSMLSNHTSEKQIEMQQMQSGETLLDLENQYAETHNKYTLALHTAADQLLVGLKNWEQSYVLRSSIRGTVNLMGIWSRNQNVTTGDLVFIVLPAEPDAPMGKAMLPAAGAGKVKAGQRVNVRINNFPDQEFGYLVGKVKSISNVPTTEGLYFVEIAFPNGLRTNYHRQLPLSQQMLGNLEIVIQEKRLIERFLQPMRKLLKG
ncbi:MAG: HlyD family efflux transporter periplasmic adaptor subunit [Bacteroidaceae bacterium]|nr:HlyD family efflux transporter periplasmic adaptor subunit [Bacteroidaceae bacterium]